jgi:hypothetical protein
LIQKVTKEQTFTILQLKVRRPRIAGGVSSKTKMIYVQ